jgi:2,3-bisphosphoglycerate-dependent phosphoglycerate mutase
MKIVWQLVFILLPFWAQAQELIPYHKAVPKITKDGTVKMPNGKGSLKIEGYLDKNVTVFYIVRHAEKDTAGGSNADLNPLGRGRANALVNIFKRTRIQKVYSTDVPRTKSTAKPLAKFKRRPVEIYNAKKQKEFLESVLAEGSGRKIFIVGHSNTVPHLVNILRGGTEEKDLPDSEYSRMYIVSVKKIGDAKVQIINF